MQSNHFKPTILLLACVVAATGLPARFPEAVVAQRVRSALLGSLLADAAAMPLHWEYSQARIASLVGSGVPEFFSPPLNLWYNGKPGGSTPYGQQSLAYLSVGGQAPGFQPTAVQAAYFQLYDPTTCPGPAGGWYLDASTKEFLANYQAGRRYPSVGGVDSQADAAAHAVLVTALLAGNTSALLDALEPVVRVTQDTAEAAAFGAAAARLLEATLVYNYTSGAAAVADTVAALRSPTRHHPFAQDAALADAMEAAAAAAAAGEASAAFILRTGQSCDYPYTLPNVAFLAALDLDFVPAARQSVSAQAPALAAAQQGSAMQGHTNSLPLPRTQTRTHARTCARQIMAGGDSGSRGCFLGAIQGARLGDSALLPQEWAAKTTAFAQVSALADALVARRQQQQ
jgi:ADP-ribosylglycohydrolase